MEETIAVQVPIAYGRRSKTRGNTYSSIVFDTAINMMGQALVVPCVNQVRHLRDLILEATHLWTAELNGDNQFNEISAKWGCVALLPHPDRELDGQIPESLLKGWATRVSRERDHYETCASVDSSGRLLIDWPRKSNGEALDLDLLLATANFPERKMPTANDIARAYWHNDLTNLDYFTKNHKNGIKTAADAKIMQELAKLF
ncbi:MAG: hypothetical protein EKK48_26085 [Candidatus Melainabacteria bacterium]|nr:MAG: hypothetical protein EKK48_26085 [Candidatus Melainabacteria bacterium]